MEKMGKWKWGNGENGDNGKWGKWRTWRNRKGGIEKSRKCRNREKGNRE